MVKNANQEEKITERYSKRQRAVRCGAGTKCHTSDAGVEGERERSDSSECVAPKRCEV